VVKKIKSKWGEGIGGKVQQTDNPDSPSYDPAESFSDTDSKIVWLLDDGQVGFLSEWERGFLMNVYGESPIPPKAHKKVSSIAYKVKKMIEKEASSGDPE
jgi:hypothetical protein